MQKCLSIIRLVVIVLAITMVTCSKKVETGQQYPEHVGDISADSSIDDPAFKPCFEGASYQYYNFGNGVQYEGEKPKIDDQYVNVQSTDSTDYGYVTIRFVVNCQRKTGRFRIQQMDTAYQEKKFNEALIADLLTRTKKLDGWLIAKNERGEAVDYYQYLTFKIERGKLTEIMP